MPHLSHEEEEQNFVLEPQQSNGSVNNPASSVDEPPTIPERKNAPVPPVYESDTDDESDWKMMSFQDRLKVSNQVTHKFSICL